MKSKIIFFVFCLLMFFQSFSFAVTLTVTNCADSGAGSLRQALTDVTTGDAIEFNITVANAGYSTGEYGAGVVTNEAGSNKWFRIIVNSALPTISKNNVYIKGFSQIANTNEAINVLGPEVEIKWRGPSYYPNNYLGAITIYGNNCTVEGLIINNGFYSGINITLGGSNEVLGNYIGVDATGTTAVGNERGIRLDYSSSNKIGDGTAGGRNVISGNGSGINITLGGSNEVLGNYIGLDATGTTAVANSYYGISLYSSSNNIIGASNVIAYNGSLGFPDGIYIEASDSIQNKITQNSMYSNYGKGITLAESSNQEIVTPEIISVTYSQTNEVLNITGTATSDAIVEIFKASGNQGRYYLGSVESNALGSFETTLDISSSGITFITGETVTTTQTDVSNNTSEFSNTKEVIITSITSYRPTLMIGTIESGVDYGSSNKTSSVASNETATYYIKVSNDGNASDTIIVTGEGNSGSFNVKYYYPKTSNTEITSQVTGEGYNLDLAASTNDELKMTVSCSSTSLSTKEITVTATSSKDATKGDSIKATTTFIPLTSEPTSEPEPEPEPTPTTETTSHATQEFSDSGLGVTVTVPANAVTSSIEVAITETTSSANPPTGFKIGGKIISLTSTPTSEFLTPVTVTIPMDTGLFGPRVYYWVSDGWSTNGITIVSYTTNSITFTTTHFTPFAAMGITADNSFRFGPNSYNPNNGSARIWYWLSSSADTTIYIMNMNGVLVWKSTYPSGTNGGQAGENNVEFIGKNSWGDTLGNGAYLFKVVQGGRVVGGGKIAVIR